MTTDAQSLGLFREPCRCIERALAAILVTLAMGCSDPTADPVSSPPDAPAPIPPPPPPTPAVEIAHQCPTVDATAVGTNSQVQVEFAHAIDPSSVPADGLRVHCNDESVEGLLHVEGPRLTLVPAAELVAGAECTATSAAGMRDTEGAPLETGSWQFTVGEGTAHDWKFEPRATVPIAALGIPQIRKTIYADGTLLLVVAVGRYLYVAASDDAASFQISDPIDVFHPEQWGTVEEVDAAYSGGRLHLFWRTLPVNTQYTDLWYSHSTTSLVDFKRPEIITASSDQMGSFQPNVAVGGDRVYLAWRDECPDQFNCWARQQQGLQLQVRTNGGDTVERREQLTGLNAFRPHLAWLNNRLTMAWVASEYSPNYEEHAVQVVDYASGLAAVDESPTYNTLVIPNGFVEVSGGNGVLHWDSNLLDGSYHYLADYNSTQRTLSEPRVLLFAPFDQYQYACSRITTDPAKNVVWLSALGEKAAPDDPTPVDRAVHISADAGATFGAPISLDFLLPYRVSGSDYVADAVCPHVAAGADGRLLIAWEHIERHGGGARSYSIQGTSGTPVPECSL